MADHADLLQGTLDLLILKSLALGPLHGWGIVKRIEQISEGSLSVNQGTLYPVLLKLEQEGSIASDWGASENNRKARFYRLTRPLLRTAAEGADTIVWLAAAPEAGAGTGGFWHDRRRRPTHLLPGTRESDADRRRLWAACVALSSTTSN